MIEKCPFCGYEEVRIFEFQNYYSTPFHFCYVCTRCHARGPVKDDEKEALVAWNKRINHGDNEK